MKVKNGIILFICAFIWGVAFVGQDAASEYVSPFTFSCIRFGIAAVLLFLASIAYDYYVIKSCGKKGEEPQKCEPKRVMTLLTAGVLCGVALFALSLFQQFGFMDPKMTSGKAGFLTATYILIVPIFRIFQKKIPSLNVWIAVALGLVGLYYLCISENFELSWGDGLVLICAVANSFHILIVEKFSPHCNPVKLCLIQCTLVSVLSMPFMFILEQPSGDSIASAMPAILFCAVMSSTIAYCLQLFGQRGVNPTPAAMIMSLESVFSALAGAVVLAQILPLRQIIGCIILFVAIILAQLPPFSKWGRNKSAI